MSAIANEIQQSDREDRRDSQTYVFDAEPFLHLGQQPVDGESYNQKKIETEEEHHVAHRVANLARQLAEQHPQRAVVGYHRRRSDMT